MALTRGIVGRAGLAGTAVAIVVNLVIFGIGSLADIDWEAGENDPSAGAVIITTLLAGALATILAIVLVRYTKMSRPIIPFMVIGVLATLASLATPFGSEAASSTQWVLAAMHIVTGIFVLGALGHAINEVQARRAASS